MIHFKIATPERVLLDTTAESLTLPTEMGEITVLANHIPLVANLVAGEIKYKHQGKTDFFAVSGGVIEVRKGDEVVVLADTAEFGHEIDLKRAEEARDRAKRLMGEKVSDPKIFQDAAAAFGRNLARIRVAHKHRTHTSKNLESGVLHE